MKYNLQENKIYTLSNAPINKLAHIHINYRAERSKLFVGQFQKLIINHNITPYFKGMHHISQNLLKLENYCGLSHLFINIR